MSDGWANGAALFEPAPPPPEPIASRARRRASTVHVALCQCNVELIYPDDAPAGALCTTCENLRR